MNKKIFIAIIVIVFLIFLGISPFFMLSNGYKYTVTGYYKSDPDESLPVKERFLDILEESEEVRMAQLVEYEIPHMDENEIFFVVKSKDGTIVRTTINKDLAEALFEHYR